MLQLFSKWQDKDPDISLAPPLNQLHDQSSFSIYIDLNGLGIQKKICLLFEKMEKVSVLREKVKQILGQQYVPSYWWFVTQFGNLLDDDSKTLQEYYLGNNSLLNIFRGDVTGYKGKYMQIFVKTITNVKLEFTISNETTLDQLKALIFEQYGGPINRSRLVYSGKYLSFNRPLSYYNIQKESVIYLYPPCRGGDDSANMPQFWQSIHLLLELEDNKRLYLESVKVSWKISDLKNCVADFFKISFQFQSLFYQQQELTDEKSLQDYKIQDDSVIHLRKSNKIYQNTQDLRIISVIGKTFRYQFHMTENATFGQLKKIIDRVESSIYQRKQKYEKIILYNGKLGVKKYDRTLLPFASTVLIIESDTGSFALHVMNKINLINTNNIQYLYDMNQYLDRNRSKDYLNFLDQQISEIQTNPVKKSIYQQFQLDSLLAIKIWTSIFFHKILNNDIRNKDFKKWKPFLKSFLNGLKQCPYFRGIGYRGVRDYQDKINYTEKNRFQWDEVTSVSKNQDIARYFSNNQGMFFEIDVVGAKDIAVLSSLNEEEIVLPPFSALEVQEVKINQDSLMIVTLREIPFPSQQRILLWVDDQPENNYLYLKALEQQMVTNQQAIQILFCRSTEDAKVLINQYKWIIFLENQNFRVVTDMVRIENGKPNYQAGVDLLKVLIMMNFKQEVLVFCRDVEFAKQSSRDIKLMGNFSITNQVDVLQKFINFT